MQAPEESSPCFTRICLLFLRRGSMREWPGPELLFDKHGLESRGGGCLSLHFSDRSFNFSGSTLSPSAPEADMYGHTSSPLGLGPEEGKRKGYFFLPYLQLPPCEVTSGWHCPLTPYPCLSQGGLTTWGSPGTVTAPGMVREVL